MARLFLVIALSGRVVPKRSTSLWILLELIVECGSWWFTRHGRVKLSFNFPVWFQEEAHGELGILARFQSLPRVNYGRFRQYDAQDVWNSLRWEPKRKRVERHSYVAAPNWLGYYGLFSRKDRAHGELSGSVDLWLVRDGQTVSYAVCRIPTHQKL